MHISIYFYLRTEKKSVLLQVLAAIFFRVTKKEKVTELYAKYSSKFFFLPKTAMPQR